VKVERSGSNSSLLRAARPADPDEGDAMIYTAWGKDGEANTLIAGEGPPRFVDGTPFDDAQQLIWTIEAESWEEAMQKYDTLQGWGTYRPL
jgi:hypothetical protein